MPIVFIDLTGCLANELIGRSCRFLQGAGTDRAQVANLNDSIAARRDVTVDILNYRRNGTPFTNELHVTPIFDSAGKLLYALGSQLETRRPQR